MQLNILLVFLDAQHVYHLRNALATFSPLRFYPFLTPSWTYPFWKIAPKRVAQLIPSRNFKCSFRKWMLITCWRYIRSLHLQLIEITRLCFYSTIWIFLLIKITLHDIDIFHVLCYCKSEKNEFNPTFAFIEEEPFLHFSIKSFSLVPWGKLLFGGIQ